jgi:arylsulfatase A-like enzyme
LTLDTWLGEVLAVLNTDGHPDTLLIVAAGSGDLAGPHAELSAGCPPLVDPLVRVPLLIRTGTEADGTRRGGLVSTNDLAPTLADWFRVPDQSKRRSRSLWPLLSDEVHAVRTIF